MFSILEVQIQGAMFGKIGSNGRVCRLIAYSLCKHLQAEQLYRALQGSVNR